MTPTHISILKANNGEMRALTNLHSTPASKIIPLLEVGRITDAIRERKYIQNSPTPIITYLNRKLDPAGAAWSGRLAMVDGYEWAPDARTESGDHVIAHMVTRLRQANVSVIPVVGYDRWENIDYREGLKSVTPRDDGHYCLRLDSSAVEDAAEPERFNEVIQSIVDELAIDPANCSVLLDFGDVSMDTMFVERIVEEASVVIGQLGDFGFNYCVVAGCSLPRTIDLAVDNRDAIGAVLRKEMIAWQTLRLSFPAAKLVSGDYGVRGPTTVEARSKYTNGKIRHTINRQLVIARGHPFTLDHSYEQMHDLSGMIVRSRHFLGARFSWGDEQIEARSRGGKPGDTTTWIAIDTNHHLTFVVQEVEEFEREIVAKTHAR